MYYIASKKPYASCYMLWLPDLILQERRDGHL